MTDAAVEHGAAETDFSNPQSCVTDIGPPLEKMLDGATTVVVQHRGAIDAIAQRLLAEKTLTALEVAKIASNASGMWYQAWAKSRELR